MVYPLLYTVNLSLFDVNAGNMLPAAPVRRARQTTRQFLSSPDFTASLGDHPGVHYRIADLSARRSGSRSRSSSTRVSRCRVPAGAHARGLGVPAVVSASLWRWIFSRQLRTVQRIPRAVRYPVQPAVARDPATALPAVIIANIWVGIPST